jgi:hypothetical protein
VRVAQCVATVRAVEVPVLFYLGGSYSHVTGIGDP